MSLHRDDPSSKGESEASVPVLSDGLRRASQGRYTVEAAIADGGMAAVVRATDEVSGQRVAIKVLKPEIADLVGTQRFLREIRIAASLQHSAILPILDSGDVDGLPYYVMPFVRGGSLKERLALESQLPIQEALDIARVLASALGAAHGAGILHRDIKPANILLDEGRPVLTDFGIAKALSDVDDERLTRSDVVIGTPGYMSPEQATAASDVDHRADMYSLACVLHEMLAGEALFQASSTRAIVTKHVAVPPTPIRSLRPSVPRAVERALLRALDKTPVDRFATMADFSAALSDRGSIESSSTDGGRTRRVATAAAVAIALVGVGTAAWWGLAGRTPAWHSPPTSVVVLPYTPPGSAPPSAQLAIELSDRLTQELHSWNATRAATSVEVAGALLDLGLETGAPLNRTSSGLRLAEILGADGMVALSTMTRGDSIFVQASLYDTRSGRSAAETILAAATVDDPGTAVTPVLGRLLGLGDGPNVGAAIGAGTRDPRAAREYLLGLEALEQSRLEDAEASLRAAVALDGAFAMALTRLAQTLFWRAEETFGFPDEVGAEIERLSTAAQARVAGLGGTHRRHVEGFFAFQRGAHDEARTHFDQLIVSDAEDLYALLMLAEVEMHDRELVTPTNGPDRPRSSLQRAWELFLRVVEARPSFELGYGQLFEVQRTIEEPLLGQCFLMAAGEQLLPPWRARLPTDGGRAFCPAARDSIVWLTRAQFDASDKAELTRGADLLFDRSVEAFQRWSAIAPDQPRALEELADAVILQRSRLVGAAPERLESLARQALQYTVEATALQPDSSAARMTRLANLHMAAGDLPAAAVLAGQVVETIRADGGGDLGTAPDGLANVLVAAGAIALALEVASGYSNVHFLRTSQRAEPLLFAGAEPTIERIRVLGALGVGGSPLQEELRRLDATWRIAGYTESERRSLRNHVTLEERSIAHALAMDPPMLADWASDVDLQDPLWRALTMVRDDPGGARSIYELAVSSSGDGGTSRAFLLGVLAGQLGLHRAAARHLSRLDSIPHSVRQFQPGWGLTVLARLLRAEHYEQLGDRAAAEEDFESFVAAMSWADPLSLPILERARQGLQRIR